MKLEKNEKENENKLNNEKKIIVFVCLPSLLSFTFFFTFCSDSSIFTLACSSYSCAIGGGEFKYNLKASDF